MVLIGALVQARIHYGLALPGQALQVPATGGSEASSHEAEGLVLVYLNEIFTLSTLGPHVWECQKRKLHLVFDLEQIETPHNE
jgi:hypothetical protein